MTTVDIDFDRLLVTVDRGQTEVDVIANRTLVNIDLDRLEADLTINRTNTEVAVDKPGVVLGVPGLRGPQGIPGSVGGFRHVQSAPSASWPVTHNLGRHPAVTIVLDTENWVVSDIDYVSDNDLTIIFPTPVTGTADM